MIQQKHLSKLNNMIQHSITAAIKLEHQENRETE